MPRKVKEDIPPMKRDSILVRCRPFPLFSAWGGSGSTGSKQTSKGLFICMISDGRCQIWKLLSSTVYLFRAAFFPIWS